jgi:hypothetical protein
MKPEKIKVLLPMVNSKFKGTRPGWVLATCPFSWRHGGKTSPHFAVSTDPKKKSRCKCLSCGYSGDLTDLLLDIQFGLRKNADLRHKFNLLPASTLVADEFADMELTPADIPDFEAPVEKNEVLFPEQWLASFKKIQIFPPAMDYCIGRGISEECLKALDVRYDPMQQRVCFPFRNFKGELMGLQGRYIGTEPVKDDKHEEGVLRYYQYGYHGHRNMHVWLGEHKLNLDTTVVLCEGPFDFAKIWMAYPNVAASFTSGLSRTKVRRISDADSIITFFDDGEGGNNAREYVDKYLPGYPILHIIPADEDGDAGAMDVDDIREALSDHVEMNVKTKSEPPVKTNP